MRNGTSGRRQRNRGSNGRRSGGQQRMQVFDSNGPDVRIRGTAHQVAEKYEALAKDASSSGDKVLAESYLQHAEHYQRLIGSWKDENKDGAPEKRTDRDLSSGERSGNNAGPSSSGDDLSLPSSILGVSSNNSDEKRTSELSAADH